MEPDENQVDTTQLTEQQLRSVLTLYEEKLCEVAELVANVRHELNNPLTGVIGQAQLLLRSELDDSTRKRIKTIEQLALRIRDTIAQLRDVQRPKLEAEFYEEKPRTPVTADNNLAE